MQQTNSDFDHATAILSRHKGLLVVLAVLGGAAGFTFSYFFTPQYRADAILIPSDEMLGLNENGAFGSLGGLASLVGANVSGNKQSEAIETLKSRALTTLYIETNGLLPILFSDRWDSAANKWKVSTHGHLPTLADGYRVFDRNIRNVGENRKTGLITFAITWKDPTLAKKWTDGLVDAANDQLRIKAIERSNRNIEYLKNASDATSVMEVRTTIYKLMETEIKKQMIASGNKDYAFRVVDPAVIPETKVFPVRSLFAILGAVFFPSFWCLISAFRSAITKSTP